MTTGITFSTGLSVSCPSVRSSVCPVSISEILYRIVIAIFPVHTGRYICVALLQYSTIDSPPVYSSFSTLRYMLPLAANDVQHDCTTLGASLQKTAAATFEVGVSVYTTSSALSALSAQSASN